MTVRLHVGAVVGVGAGDGAGVGVGNGNGVGIGNGSTWQLAFSGQIGGKLEFGSTPGNACVLDGVVAVSDADAGLGSALTALSPS